MVLLPKQWKSRSSPGFAGGAQIEPIHDVDEPLPANPERRLFCSGHVPADVGAGWSSPVARQAHNLKVAGSNPAPATNFFLKRAVSAALFVSCHAGAARRGDEI